MRSSLIETVIPSNHRILYRPLLLLPSIFPSIRVFSNESALCMRWPKYWSFQARVLEWVAISFFRKIFLTQGSNPGLPHCRHMLYRLSHFRLGSLKIRRLGAKTPESTTINWNAVINLDSGTGRSWCAGIEFCLVLPT